jgi:hypothetical protein
MLNDNAGSDVNGWFDPGVAAGFELLSGRQVQYVTARLVEAPDGSPVGVTRESVSGLFYYRQAHDADSTA